MPDTRDQHGNTRDIAKLAPIIIVFTLVIVATIVIGNMRRNRQFHSQPGNSEVKSSSDIKMVLSPFAKAAVSDVSEDKKNDFIPKADTAFALATQELQKGEFQSAEERLRTALVFHPEDVRLYGLLGSAFYQAGRYKDAEMMFRRQAYLGPGDSVAYNNLGAALAKQKRYSEAINAMEQVLKNDPSSPTTALNLSGMHSMAGNTKEALQYFRKAYDSLGERILPFAHNPNFKNIRSEEDFIKIVREAEKKISGSAAKDGEK